MGGQGEGEGEGEGEDEGQGQGQGVSAVFTLEGGGAAAEAASRFEMISRQCTGFSPAVSSSCTDRERCALDAWRCSL